MGKGTRSTRTEATVDPARPLSPATLSAGPGRFLALYEIGRQFLEGGAPAQVLRTIEEAIATHLAPEQACLLSGRGDGYRAQFARGLVLEGPANTWPVSWTVIRQVEESGLATLASDVQQNAQLREAESIQRFRIRSVMCVPLPGPSHGVLYVANRGERAFVGADLEFLTAVSLYAATALARARELEQATEALSLSGERLEALRSELLRGQIVGASPALLSAYESLRRFAEAGARVLLRGETGTGKELFARAYARHSGRAQGPYVPVTIPALAPTLVESELFGHVRGSFTEASRDKKGRLEVAHGGVLFLDEVGDIDTALQTKLLRFLDSGELFRVGDNELRRVDTLVVSATNRPLEKDVADGRFRADLLPRLGHAIVIPPLRERPDDVPLLVAHFLERHDRGPRKKSFSPESLDVLRRHTWPFNVRELQQVVERVVCLVDREVIRPEDLPDYVRREAEAGGAAPTASAAPSATSTASSPAPLREVVDQAEREHILRTLEFTQGNRRRAIELLQVAPETFYRRLEEYGLHKKG